MRTLVIIPAYNEARNIGRVIADLEGLGLPLDILVVNDGSTDGTSSAARGAGRATVLDLPVNLGIGGAVQTGFIYAARNGYDQALQFDADGQHLASEIPKILAVVAEGRADVAIGSRFLEKESSFKSTFMRRKGIFIFKVVNYLLIRQVVTDNTSGFRAYNRRAISFLAGRYPSDYPEPESVVLLGKHGFKMAEVAVNMRSRTFGRSSIRGWRIIYYMIKVLLSIFMTALRGRSDK